MIQPFIVLLIGIALAFAPPTVTWTAPGELTVHFTGVLWYQKIGQPAVPLPCESPCTLRRGGDALYTPQAGAILWAQNKTGETSPVVVVSAEPLWFRTYFPIMAMAP